MFAAPMFGGQSRGFIGGGEGSFIDNPQKINPPANILAIPILTSFGGDGDVGAGCFVAEYVDNGVKHTGPFQGIAASHCSEITFGIHCKNCTANAMGVLFYFS
jgi:hypothetical protein